MWKFLSRGFRETFERGATLSRNADARVKSEAQSKQACCWTRRWKPLAVRNVPAWKEKCTGKEQDEATKEKSAPHCYFEEWLGAFSYSSALVLGWVLTQPYAHWRKKWCEFEIRPKLPQILPGSLVPLFTRVAVSQPIAGAVQATDVTPQLINNDNSDQNITFGPITAEQALEEAAEELRSVHNSVVGEVENRRGVDLIGRGETYRAVALFRSASERGSAPAAYNMGQCYEMGIGTKQDFAQAAKWYKKAAELGHATAMYNLGVFYAHGWGGLEASRKAARGLFLQAAAKGQPDARAALGLDAQHKPPPLQLGIAQECNDWGLSKKEKEPSNNLGNDPEELYNLGISYEHSFEENNAHDPYLIMQMYQLASELGHSDAKSRLIVMKAFDAIGLLTEFLVQKRKKPWSQYTEVLYEEAKSVP